MTRILGLSYLSDNKTKIPKNSEKEGGGRAGARARAREFSVSFPESEFCSLQELKLK